MLITVCLYGSEKQSEWDSFIENSKNGTFILKRAYMEYHSDRFTDFSLMFYKERKLVAVMPASLHEQQVRSHGGLTYGGIISNTSMKTKLMLEVFEALIGFLKEHGITSLLYKRVPTIYHLYPADEDLYALFRNNAKLIRRDISASILLKKTLKFSELRKRGVKKALKNGLTVKQSNNFHGFIDMENNVLNARHHTQAVHSACELELLASRFPDNIKLFMTSDGNSSNLAGVTVFETQSVAHLQYIANSDVGCKVGALDLLISHLIEKYSKTKRYFDFGISTEKDGTYLNEGLIAQKEGFGGRGIVYDTYEISL